jgi:hypothetical protein
VAPCEHWLLEKREGRSENRNQRRETSTTPPLETLQERGTRHVDAKWKSEESAH